MNAMIVSEKIPQDVQKIMRNLRDAGHDAVLVGGAVRDLALSLSPKDWDIATSATPDEMFALFGAACKDQKQEMGTVQVGGHEVTTFRREGGYDDGRHPGTVVFTKALTDDLSRRDFTCNAIALRYVTAGNWCIIDPWNGLNAMARKELVAVGEADKRFEEDHLRIMRAVRFAGKYGWNIEPKTFRAMRVAAPLLRRVSRERVQQEMTMLLRNNPERGLTLLETSDVMRELFPMLQQMVGCTQNTHHDFDVWNHARMAVGHMAYETQGMDNEQRDALLWSALLHDCGKPATRNKTATTISFLQHEIVGAKIADAFCRQWKFSNDMRETIVHLTRYHMFCLGRGVTQRATRKFVQRVGEESIDNLLLLRLADNRAHRASNAIGTTKLPSYWKYTLAALEHFKEEREAGMNAITTSHLAINGHRIMSITGWGPCKKVGDVQKQMLDMVIEDPSMNTVEDLSEWLYQVWVGGQNE